MTNRFLLRRIIIEPIQSRPWPGTIHGFRFGDCAYLTDHSVIPEKAWPKLQNLDVLFLDALATIRIRPTQQSRSR